MDERATHIDIVLAGGAQREHDAAVHDEGQRGHGQHHGLFDVFGMTEADNAFVEDPGGERHQGDGIDECREHAGAVVAISLGFIRGFGLKVKAKPGEEKRQGVGKVVPGVGEKRQRVRAETGVDLDDDEDARRGQGPFQAAAGTGVVMMMMSVRVRVRMHSISFLILARAA